MKPLARLLSRTVLLASLAGALPAQPNRTANDRVYSDAQAGRGRALYREKCANCHGDSLEGKSAPALAGSGFLAVWGVQPLSELAGKIRSTMPANDPGKLTPSETSDLVAYILQVGKFPAGQAELSGNPEALKAITIAPGQTTTGVAVVGQVPVAAPLGNLNQVMRGILFPSSNILFNTQLNDPGAPPKRPATADPGTGNFSWTDWGAGIYTGWQVVDNAAVVIADSAPLLLVPGRRCENGKPVPVDRPDWIKFTQELVEVGRKAYKASQSRNQQAVSDVTSDLADACLHCHQVYRDKRGARPGDPASSAGRCTP